MPVCSVLLHYVIRMEVWPGFITSILQYESSIMLMAEVSHKILRTNTMLDLMYDLYNRVRGDFHTECGRKVIGEIVLTRLEFIMSFYWCK